MTSNDKPSKFGNYWDGESPLDTLELPYDPPDVQEEPEVVAAGSAKPVAKIPKQ